LLWVHLHQQGSSILGGNDLSYGDLFVV